MYADQVSECGNSVVEELAELPFSDAADTRYMGVADGQIFQLCALRRAAEMGGANATMTANTEQCLPHTMLLLPTASPSPRVAELDVRADPTTITTAMDSCENTNNNTNSNNNIDVYSEQLSHTLGLHHHASVLSFRSPVMPSAEGRRGAASRMGGQGSSSSTSAANRSPSMAARLAWQDSLLFRCEMDAEEMEAGCGAEVGSADGLHMCRPSCLDAAATTPRPLSDTRTAADLSTSELDHASFTTPTRQAASSDAQPHSLMEGAETAMTSTSNSARAAAAARLCSPEQFFLSYVPHASPAQQASDGSRSGGSVAAHTPARRLPYACAHSPLLSGSTTASLAERERAAAHTHTDGGSGNSSNNNNNNEPHRPVLHLGSHSNNSTISTVTTSERHASPSYTTPVLQYYHHPSSSSPSRRDASPQLRPPQRLSLPPSATRHTRYYSFCGYPVGAGAMGANATFSSSSYNGMTAEAELCTPVRHGEAELLLSSSTPQRPRSQERASTSAANSPSYTRGSLPRPFSVSAHSASQGRPPLRRPSLQGQAVLNTAHVTALRSPQPSLAEANEEGNNNSNSSTSDGSGATTTSAPPPVLYERVLNAPGMAVQENMSLIHWGCAGLLVVLESGVYLRQDPPAVHCVFVNTAPARPTVRVSCVVSSRALLRCCPRPYLTLASQCEAASTADAAMEGGMLYMAFGLSNGTVIVHEYRAEPVSPTAHTSIATEAPQNDATGFVWCTPAMQRRFMRRTGVATLHCDAERGEGAAAMTSMHLAAHTLYVGGMRGVLLVYDLQRCTFVPITHGTSTNSSSNSSAAATAAMAVRTNSRYADATATALHARTHSFPSTVFPRHHFLAGLRITTAAATPLRGLGGTTVTDTRAVSVQPANNNNNNNGEEGEGDALAPPVLRGLYVASPIFHIAVTEDRNHIALGTQDSLVIYHEGQLQVCHARACSDLRECGDAAYFVRGAHTRCEPQAVLRDTRTPVRAFDWLYRPTLHYSTQGDRAAGTGEARGDALCETSTVAIAMPGVPSAASPNSPTGSSTLSMRSAILVYGHERVLGVYVLGTGRTVVRRELPRAVHAVVCGRTSPEVIACTEMSSEELGHYHVRRPPASPAAATSAEGTPQRASQPTAAYHAAWSRLRHAVTHQTTASSSSWSSTLSGSPTAAAVVAMSPAGRGAQAMPILALRPAASPVRPAAMAQAQTQQQQQQQQQQQVRGPLYLFELQLGNEEGLSGLRQDLSTLQDYTATITSGGGSSKTVLRLKGCYGSETRSAIVYTALSPDGTQLATAGPEEMVRFWRLALRRQKAGSGRTAEAPRQHVGRGRQWRYVTSMPSGSEGGPAASFDLCLPCATSPLMATEALR